MCVNFTDANIATSKDCFPLPNIDQLVDATMGFKVISFMDPYSGYHQIQMHPINKEKTSFVLEEETFFLHKNAIWVKNTRAINQRLVNKMFEHQTRRNIEVYIDDMMVKTKVKKDHIFDLEEAFSIYDTMKCVSTLRNVSLG